MTAPADPRDPGERGAPLFQVERRERIMERVRRDGRVDVADLARSFDVTSETIRRDLIDLQEEQLLRRVHGGAIPFGPRVAGWPKPRVSEAVERMLALVEGTVLFMVRTRLSPLWPIGVGAVVGAFGAV